MNHHERHFSHYLILLTGLAILGSLFVLFRFNERIQILVGAAGCLFYILWGIFHHASEERVTKLVIFEYVSFGLLAFLLMVLFVVL